ncbi:hypothetical protein AcV7_008344 [Taiwanofungus camphoratus]|nr:hypothetical protein AcV7_008344 [Antrodia cinnamomea]
MATFDSLVADLTRDVHRVQPKDALQFCANWFQSRLEEQRTRARDVLAQSTCDLPRDHYLDTPLSPSAGGVRSSTVSPFAQPYPKQRTSLHNSMSNASPFGTLNVPGNALLSDDSADRGSMTPPTFRIDGEELSPSSPLTPPNPFASFANGTVSPNSPSPGDYLHPPTSTILARRTSVSAESIAVDSETDEPLPVFPKTADQLRRIRASIANNFIFRDLDDEQEIGVLNAMREIHVVQDEVVIRQGDVGEYFYVVESGWLNCYIRPEPLPPTWLTGGGSASMSYEKFLQPGYHPDFGKKVAECREGSSFGELALMYGHPRAATVLAMEPSTLWSLDRITFRTIILKAAHRRRTMYEQFLSSVPLLTSLEPEERSKIADALVSRVFMDGEAIVRQGDMGDTFFFVEEGEAVVTKTQLTADGETRESKVGHYTKGDYFGGAFQMISIVSPPSNEDIFPELSLLRLEPRAATVSAIVRTDPSMPKLKVAALDAHAFTRLLGPLREIMERNAGQNYGPGPRLSR